MGIISKNIENLKPDKEYIITVRAKNNDVNILSNYTDSIRFQTPTDSTVPSAPTNLVLAASFFNVLFKYTDSVDEDAGKYEYELYKQAQIQIVSGLNSIISGETPHRTGFVQTNVFVVSVDDNSTTTSTSGSPTNPVKYYGRVRTIDTSGNISGWTSIVASGDTPLIDEDFIGSLTAAKITAGTIGAHEIILTQPGTATTITSPDNKAILRSSDYDGNYNNTTDIWTSGTNGWIISGDGRAEFNNIIARGAINGGTIDIGGSDANSFHVDANGNMWLGNATYGTSAPFRVSNVGALTATGVTVTGEITATSGTFTGTVNANAGTFTSTVTVGGATSGTLQVGTGTNKIKIVGTSADAGTYINTGSTTATTGNGFYFGADGKVRIASSTNSLTFDGTSLTINGGGTFTGALSGGTISIGSGNSIFKADSNGIYLGDATFANAKFSVTPAGFLKSTSGTIGGWSIGVPEVTAGFFIIGEEYKIVTPGNTSFTSIGAANNNVNTVFTATGVGSGTGTAKPNDGVNTLTNGSGASLSILSPQGWAWFSSGIITTSISGYGGPTTTAGATSQNTTTVSTGTRGFLRNISHGSTKPGSPVLGDIHFTT